MKTPADIDDCKEMVEIVASNLNVDEEEIESILGRVLLYYADAEGINAGVDKFVDILKTQAYREAVDRHKQREKYDTKEEENKLRKEKGGILKREFPNTNPNQWEAKCDANFCRFDHLLMDNKVDRVLCPECTRELWIDPA